MQLPTKGDKLEVKRDVDDQLYDWVENCEVEDEDLRTQALVYTAYECGKKQ